MQLGSVRTDWTTIIVHLKTVTLLLQYWSSSDLFSPGLFKYFQIWSTPEITQFFHFLKSTFRNSEKFYSLFNFLLTLSWGPSLQFIIFPFWLRIPLVQEKALLYYKTSGSCITLKPFIITDMVKTKDDFIPSSKQDINQS